MTGAALPTAIEDRAAYESAIRHLRNARVVLPTFAELSDPAAIPADIATRIVGVDRDAADPSNLFRVHWFNDVATGGIRPVPPHVVLPGSLTGVDAPIAVALGNSFPMIGAHKVLAAYACLVWRLVTGRFDPARNKAVWPSTGNYCRGGVAISRIMGVRGVAVLPEGMSAERFDWLSDWIEHPDDIVRTPGSESNVKEIYDACDALDRDPANVILNQFSEFANYLGHYRCTGPALDAVYAHLRQSEPELSLAAFVAGTGSGGTLGAGDLLKQAHGARIVAVEPLECPTMLYNGYGAHNIQGIGDKHIPLIQNAMNTDAVVGVSDRNCDRLNALFNTASGRAYLVGRCGVDAAIVARLADFGLSSIANVLASIKTAKHYGLGPDDLIVTVATDGASMYESERAKTVGAEFAGGYDAVAAAETFGRDLAAIGTDHVLETGWAERTRIFNLGYFTWVEQRGVELEAFDERRDQRFWTGLHDVLPQWDETIRAFNAETGVNRPG